MRKSIIAVLILGIILIGSLYFFKRSEKQSLTTSHPSPTESMSLSNTSTPSAKKSQNTVTLTQSGFSPATLTIKAGQKVIWMNKSGGEATINSNPHPTHTNYPPLNLNLFSDGQTLSLTFSTPGTYGYHNHLNPNQRGTIIVQ